MTQNNNFENKNHQNKHQIKSSFHTMKIEELENSFKQFFGEEKFCQIELDICREFDASDYQSLLLYEQFLGE